MPGSSEPRILVLGAGSAGTRHARNLAALGARVTLEDADPAGPAGVGDHDGVVVASPTVFHRDQAMVALAAGAAVLVEKPLAVGEDGLDELVAAAGDRLTVGYNLRLHPPVEAVRSAVTDGVTGAVRSVHLWFGSLLSDWRPGVDYRTTYSAQAALGGGILLDASHEIDLLVWLFGAEWAVESALMEHRSDLEIDVEDTVEATLRSPAGVEATLDLDCVSPSYRRGIEVVGDEATVRLDWATGTVETVTPEGSTLAPATDSVDESYRREAAAFLSLVDGSGAPVVTAAEGAATVRLCERIRERSGWGSRGWGSRSGGAGR